MCWVASSHSNIFSELQRCSLRDVLEKQFSLPANILISANDVSKISDVTRV
jgi:hypothetical protein